MAYPSRGPDRDLRLEVALDPSVRDVVTRSPLVCFVAAVPSKVIVAASPSTERLFAAGEESVIGRNMEDFLSDEPIEGMVNHMLEGRVVGYESLRRVRQGDGDVEFHAWVQALGDVVPPHYALVVAWQRDWSRMSGPPDGGEQNPPLVGTIGPDLLIERISAEAETVLGYGPEALIGTPFLRLAAQPDVANVLLLLAQAATSSVGALHRARIKAADGSLILCSLLVFPLVPLPSAAFALLPGDEIAHVDGNVLTGQAVQQVADRIGLEVEGGILSRQLAEAPWGTWPGLNRLSTRELDIVRRVDAGERVPEIARALYLSQSTIRNHLSTAFKKLGVASQQELIILLREVSKPSGHN